MGTERRKKADECCWATGTLIALTDYGQTGKRNEEGGSPAFEGVQVAVRNRPQVEFWLNKAGCLSRLMAIPLAFPLHSSPATPPILKSVLEPTRALSSSSTHMLCHVYPSAHRDLFPQGRLRPLARL